MHDVEWERLNIPRFLALVSLTSLAENVVLHPFYTVKVQQQVDVTSPLTLRHLSGWPTARHIVAKKGIRGLYPGFWTSTVATMPAYGLYLVSYHW